MTGETNLDEMTDEQIIAHIFKYEGPYTVEEARLTYQKRKKLPKSAFCGPGRSYPAHDKAHVKNAIARLGTFGSRLSPATRRSIFNCLKKRAKRYGIEISEDVLKKYKKKAEETLEWYLERRKEKSE